MASLGHQGKRCILTLLRWKSEMDIGVTLAGIAYLIIKSEVYGSIGLPYIRTYAPEVMSFLEASGR